MKKNRVLCLLLAVLMALSMAGCKGNSPGGETSHTGSSKKKPSKADIDSTSIRDPNTDRLDGSGGTASTSKETMTIPLIRSGR